MSKRVIRTAVAVYDDGSEGVLSVNKLTPCSGDPFMTIDNPDGSDGGVIVATPEQAKQLIAGIRAAAKEIWES